MSCPHVTVMTQLFALEIGIFFSHFVVPNYDSSTKRTKHLSVKNSKTANRFNNIRILNNSGRILY